MIAVQMVIIFGGFSHNVVKAYSDVSEEATASLFRVTKTVSGGC
jgi:hypothetical protein